MDKELKIGLCLSGGGSRAVAFHLGCMRALNDLGLLEKVKIISTVSGGSIIGGLYAYSSTSFEEFEQKVFKFLQTGLDKTIWLKYFGTLYFLLAALNWILIVSASILGQAMFKVFNYKPSWLSIQRYFSRTKIFIEYLNEKLFDNKNLNDLKNDHLKIVINATELVTCKAFRFGSNNVSHWTYGSVDPSTITVAKAVGCSAAYPLLLPSLDDVFEFQRKNSETKYSQRVVLTDGGVYENLGLSPLLPGRDKNFGYKAEKCNIIIACDAGNKFEDTSTHPQWIIPRLTKCFATVMRRVQSLNFNSIHQLKINGDIDAFVLSHLNQDDDKLPYKSPNLTLREKVENYPTDFSAMKDSDIANIVNRGEELTKILVSKYL